jgi:hypothetical protein
MEKILCWYKRALHALFLFDWKVPRPNGMPGLLWSMLVHGPPAPVPTGGGVGRGGGASKNG